MAMTTYTKGISGESMYSDALDQVTSGGLVLPTATSGQLLTGTGTWSAPTFYPAPQQSGYTISSTPNYTLNIPEPTWKLLFFGDGTFSIHLNNEVSWFRRTLCTVLFGSKWIKLRKGLAKQIETALDMHIQQRNAKQAETIT